MKVLSERYDLFMERLKKYGLKYQYTLSGNIEDAARITWKTRFTAITGKEPPAEFAS
jgi:hypothetical protein